MHKVLVVGAGKIGTLIAQLLATAKDYSVHLADIDEERVNAVKKKITTENFHSHVLDSQDNASLHAFLKKNEVNAIVSCLPYHCNINIAESAKEFKLHYFDLTEDNAITQGIREIAKKQNTAFVPQCGLAPGFINIAAHDLTKHFDSLDKVLMRVGALPTNPNNALKYSLTWSTDGLINEYGNLCEAVVNGKPQTVLPLEGLETIEIDGLLYEAFNTSGGLSTLAETHADRVNTMNYKTLRYPGHCKSIRLLMNDLKMNEDRDTLKRILERAIPKTMQDVVLVYVSVSGHRNGEFLEEMFVKKYYPKIIAGQNWSAIQVTTASGACAALDTVLCDPESYRSFIRQDQFALEQILSNRFGQVYA